jgi:F-type H+-transporting ATPase subunit a
MNLERDVVFSPFGVPITSTVVTTWVMVAALSIVAIVAGRRIRDRPGGWQSVAEWCTEALIGMLDETAGPVGRRFLPLVASLGIFIVVANALPILPFVEAPTADINTPVALALLVFCSSPYFGVRELGLWGYLRKFAEPVPILLPINILHYVSRTFSLAIRLFGNMLSHQLIVAIILLILPLVVPVILEVFGLFVGMLQAYIFVVLTTVYLGAAVQAEEAI